MKRWTIIALIAVSVSGCAGSTQLSELCSGRSESRRVICQADGVSAFLLRTPGDPASGSTCPGSGFRGYAIQSPAELTAHGWSLLDGSLAIAEGMNCGAPRDPEFKPEIGLRARSGEDVVEILVSFECDSWFWWLNGQPAGPSASGLRCARGSLLEIVESAFPDEKAFGRYWGADSQGGTSAARN